MPSPDTCCRPGAARTALADVLRRQVEPGVAGSVDRLARVVVVVAVGGGLVRRARAASAPPGVVGDVAPRLAHVVRVVGLGKLMAKTRRVLEPARVGGTAGHERG